MKITALMAISADGFIAKSDDETPWSAEEFNCYNDLCSAAGNLIIGRRTYEIMKREGELDKLQLKNLVVVSKQDIESSDPMTVVSSPVEAVKYMKSVTAELVILGGGTKLLHSFLLESLIDELILHVEPILLGSGYPLFGELTSDCKLKLLECSQLGGNTASLHYQVLK